LIPRGAALSYFCIPTDEKISNANSPIAAEVREYGRGSSRSAFLDASVSGTEAELGPVPGPSIDDFNLAPNPRDENQTARSVEEALLLSAIEHEILDPFTDTYCNKHLAYAIIEAIVVRLVPEVSRHSVTELMGERGLWMRG
jgi:hypothetical protein